ncbi:MAG TPA: ABC transporter permease [Gemmatimonadales bacterium]|jgi:putative ABC transport system permease protein
MPGSLIQDLRYAVRGLRGNPVFTLIAVATLALGIGATSTLFTVVDAVLLRPLPFPAPERLVSLSEYSHDRDQGVAADANIIAWRHAHTLDELATYTRSSTVLTGHGVPVQLNGASVTPNYFGVLGVQPIAGRVLLASDTAAGAADVVVISRTLWRDRFGGDRAVVGRSIDLDGKPTVVVGVLNDLDDISTAAFWQPLQVQPSTNGSMFFYGALARLKPDVTIDAARRELTALVRQADAARPASQRGSGVMVMTLHDRVFGSVRKALILLFGAGCFLLLIACANVANLLLTRSATRRREVAVRIALGAGRIRLARQIVAESVVLSLLGAGIGMLIPVWAVGAFVRLSPDSIGRLAHAQVDGRVLAFAAIVGVATGLVFGAIPAWIATRPEALDALKEASARTTGSAGQQQFRRVLVATELATALVLLTGAGLLTRSFLNVLAVDPGYRPDHLLGASIRLPRERYPAESAQEAFFRTLLEKVRAIPGVRAAELTDAYPSAGFSMSTTLAALSHATDSTPVAISNVGREYPRTIGLGLVAGRSFDSSDAASSGGTVLLSAGAARALFPHQDPVGQLLPASSVLGGPLRVVGVVKNVAQLGLDVPPMAHVYVLDQSGDQSVIVLRADGDVARIEPAVRRAVASIDPSQPVASFVKVDDALAHLLAPRRLNFLLLDVFAGLALLLAAVGVYGVMGMQVAQRTREMGIRVALGASARSVRGLVFRQGMTMVVAGCAAGLAGSLLLSRLLAGLLYGVGVRDAGTFVAAPLLLCCVAALACYLPARRATTVDPMIALRNE